MTHISSQPVGVILDNYADVIEGGNTYRRSGTAYRGIPGTRSNDPDLRAGLTVTADQPMGPDTVYTDDVFQSVARWVKTTSPAYFLVCLTATHAENVDAARKITDLQTSGASSLLVVSPVFPADIEAGDTFAMRQGFKRVPNGIDILEANMGFNEGMDRYFDLSVKSSGAYQEWYGAGLATYETTLELRLRMLKYARGWDAVSALLENLAIIRPILCRGANPDHRDGTYVQALLPTGQEPEIVVNDAAKVVVVDRYKLRYRIATTYK